ncbi:MAG: biotin transporter BioY [Deltaproteobacteria bacterium]|nr:biotin transporter BioY [Deltaproteobacteria bacterium]
MSALSIARALPARLDAFHAWRARAGVLETLLLAVLVATGTGLLAQVRLPLPWTPVPVTGQTFAVLLSGVLFGRRAGPWGQALYLGLGAAGLPWFAGATGGLAVLAGPTAGYCAGFVIAPLVLGLVVERVPRRVGPLFVLLLAASILLVHLPGLLGLALWQHGLGLHPTVPGLLAMGLLPFLPGEMVKVAGVALTARVLGPRR